ncbi:hypothetical protein ACOM2C_10550 [Pseudarthrobacter sp. So.54]
MVSGRELTLLAEGSVELLARVLPVDRTGLRYPWPLVLAPVSWPDAGSCRG